ARSLLRLRANFKGYVHDPSPIPFPFPGPGTPSSTFKLSHLIVYALHGTKLHSSVTLAALVLLWHSRPIFQPLGDRQVTACLYLLASKIICDNTYSNKLIVAQGTFWLRGINQMERKLVSQVGVDTSRGHRCRLETLLAMPCRDACVHAGLLNILLSNVYNDCMVASHHSHDRF
ncbi:hypothetical protein J3R83DRAFT_13649, partial [Lanmaoa asiatica]